jgi:hypothetical protein
MVQPANKTTVVIRQKHIAYQPTAINSLSPYFRLHKIFSFGTL